MRYSLETDNFFPCFPSLDECQNIPLWKKRTNMVFYVYSFPTSNLFCQNFDPWSTFYYAKSFVVCYFYLKFEQKQWSENPPILPHHQLFGQFNKSPLTGRLIPSTGKHKHFFLQLWGRLEVFHCQLLNAIKGKERLLHKSCSESYVKSENCFAQYRLRIRKRPDINDICNVSKKPTKLMLLTHR